MSLPIFEGKTYLKVRIVACGFGIAKTGTRQVYATGEVVEHAEYIGEQITWYGYFTDATTDRTIESLQHMGWKGDDLAELEDLGREACAEKLPDVVDFTIQAEQYDGAYDNKVQWVNKPGGGAKVSNPLVGADLKAFAAQMRSKVQSVRGAGGAQRKTSGGGNGQRSTGGGGAAPHPNAPGGGLDDIPF